MAHSKRSLPLEQANQNHATVRKEAEVIAEFLGLEIRDEEREEGRSLSEEEAALSLRDQLREKNEMVAPPQPPAGCRIEKRLSGDEVTPRPWPFTSGFRGYQ